MRLLPNLIPSPKKIKQKNPQPTLSKIRNKTSAIFQGPDLKHKQYPSPKHKILQGCCVLSWTTHVNCNAVTLFLSACIDIHTYRYTHTHIYLQCHLKRKGPLLNSGIWNILTLHFYTLSVDSVTIQIGYSITLQKINKYTQIEVHMNINNISYTDYKTKYHH